MTRRTLVFSLAAACFLFIARSASADLTSGLVAFYPFNGNANDESGNGNHGIVSGATLTSDRFGTPNRAYHFGLSNFIEVPTSATLDIQGPITLAAWVFMESSENCQTIFDKESYRMKGWGGNPVGYALELYTPQQQIVSTNQTRPVGVWTHVAGTWDGTTMSVYQNGVLVSSVPATGAMPQNTSSLFFGKQSFLPFPACWFFGSLDELRVYNRALSPSEIGDLARDVAHECSVGARFVGGTMSLDFRLATNESVQWNVWLSHQNVMIPFWSVPLPAINPPAQFPLTIPNFPSLGTIGFLSTMTTPAGGIRCSDWLEVGT